MEENNGQKAKNYIKSFSKKIVSSRKFRIIVIVILLLFVMIQSTYVIKIDDSAFKEGDMKNVPYVTQKKITDSIGGNNITSVDGKYSLGKDLDTVVDELLSQLKENGGRIDEYIDKDKQKKYIKCFIQAEIATLYPDISGRTPDETKKIIGNDDYKELQGRIYIYRKDENGNEQLMRYISNSEFNNKVTNNDVSIKQCYTLNENNELLVASVSYNTNNRGERVAVVSIDKSPMNYQEELKAYSMPFSYLWALLVMSDDQDFVYKLAQLGMDSEVRITVYDNWNKITTVIDDTTNTTKETVAQNWKVNKSGIERYGEDTVSSNTNDTTVTSNTIVENSTISKGVTYADTWIAKYEKLYYRMKKEPKITENTNELDDFDNSNKLVNSYQTEKNDKNEYQVIYEYERVNSHKVKTICTTESVEYKENDAKIQEKTDKDKDTPDNFVKLLDRFNKAKKNLFSCTSWLFETLESNEKTKDLVYTTKYLFYKSSGTSYGVTEFDSSKFEIKNLSNVTELVGNTVKDKVWFALKDLGYSDYAVAGVMGNIHAESGFNVGSIEYDTGVGAGLCQWSYGRRDALEAYAKSKGKNWDSEDIQVEFLIGELTPGGGADGFATYNLMANNGYSVSDWEDAKSIEDATEAFMWLFERPGVPRLDERISAAKEYYNTFKGKSKPSGNKELVDDGDGYTQIYCSSSGKRYKEYKQFEGSYSTLSYLGYGSISSAGCSITAISTVLTGYGVNVTPGDLRDSDILPAHFINRGVSCTKAPPDVSRIVKNLREGKAMVASIAGELKVEGASKYYSEHYIALLDIDSTGNKVYVSDPGSNSTNGWANLNDIISIVDYGGILYTGE